MLATEPRWTPARGEDATGLGHQVRGPVDHSIAALKTSQLPFLLPRIRDVENSPASSGWNLEVGEETPGRRCDLARSPTQGPDGNPAKHARHLATETGLSRMPAAGGWEFLLQSRIYFM